VRGVKLKKNEKKTHFFNSIFLIFLLLSFLAGPLALHFKDNLYNLKRFSNNILNHSK